MDESVDHGDAMSEVIVAFVQGSELTAVPELAGLGYPASRIMRSIVPYPVSGTG